MDLYQHPAYETESFSMSSRAAGSDYRIMVGIPQSYGATTRQYPVLYVLDGDDLFGTVAETSRAKSGAREIGEVIVVGIGYLPIIERWPHDARRAYEFSTEKWDLEASESGRAIRQVFAGAGIPPRFGGLMSVLEFLTTELTPAIGARYRVDPTDRALLGHSASGHFVIQALLRRPEAFARYVSISPALIYNDSEVFALEEEYARVHKDLPVDLLLCAGSAETLQMRPVHIVSQTARLAEQLGGRNYPNLRLSCEFFTGRSHATVVTEAVHRALEMFWPPK